MPPLASSTAVPARPHLSGSSPLSATLRNAEDRSERVLVIGAGTSGLAMGKALRDAGITYDCVEREPDLGGNWNIRLNVSSVCESTHLISSKKLTEYPDHPMPESWPEYPSQGLVLEYLRSYAERFGLRESIEFGVGVRHAQPLDPHGWLVELDDGRLRRYGAIAIANGHNWDPAWPDFPGEFSGLALHSSQYKSPDLLQGRRVLVVGGGNSGCDLAVESAQHAATTRLSLRRGYHFLPKFFHGTPIDICGERLLHARVPLAVRRALAHAMVFFLLGTRRGTGLPRPDHRLFETHPTINSQLYYALRHGDLAIRPNIEQLEGDHVRFVDGSVEPFDVILYATGFRLSFPFLDSKHLNWCGDSATGRPELYLNVFSPMRDDLFVLGMIQPDSGQWGLVDLQSQLVARTLLAQREGSRCYERFVDRKQRTSGSASISYLATPRHRLEVEHFSYRRLLRRELRRLGKAPHRVSQTSIV
ncbi:flavin-containing monooxygenase [Botrimarina hoheduenensis]|uniref:Putative oxidoreductase CzcO n=1 Tax=Botrimarina hoheduenensis TaxID=2528000 RepID=A0A5C5W836_9BACT|nr:NAD(P)-binding domain-containing protein [Botrimarina hoheduenensis]TWT46423.1 putative oxidoreductase CzcO [Botrimarina hoheduenensis]